MTRDELIKEAQKHWNKMNVHKRFCGSEFSFYDGFIEGFEANDLKWHFVGLDDKPQKSGLYLCYRIWKYQKIYELIHWDGNFWTTGGDVDDRIIAWCNLPTEPKVDKNEKNLLKIGGIKNEKI